MSEPESDLTITGPREARFRGVTYVIREARFIEAQSDNRHYVELLAESHYSPSNTKQFLVPTHRCPPELTEWAIDATAGVNRRDLDPRDGSSGDRSSGLT